MHEVVPSAVSAAVSAAIAMRITTSQKFFFIVLIFLSKEYRSLGIIFLRFLRYLRDLNKTPILLDSLDFNNSYIL